MNYDQFRHVVWQLSSQCFLRHFRDYRDKDHNEEGKQYFAITCLELVGERMSAAKIYEPDLPQGFDKVESGCMIYYIWERKDD